MRESKLHIAYFIGTRPEVIRSAQTLRLLAKKKGVRLSIVNSGQHYDDNMMGAFLRELSVPDASINLGVGSGKRSEQLGAILTRTAEAIATLQPSCLCVFGDTNSSLGAGLAAISVDVPLVHIEAGCRSNDMTLPEEMNRRILDHAAGLLLAVSDGCVANLDGERAPGVVRRVGDPLFDIFTESFAGSNPRDDRGLVTLHRPENVDDRARLRQIVGELSEAAHRTGIEWMFPVHPRTRPALPPDGVAGVRFVEPLSYGELLRGLGEARVCVTDSGGLQKEALWAGVPCVTMRPSTEWVETVFQGANTLAQPGGLVDAILRASDRTAARDFSDPYGSGNAAKEIAAGIIEWLHGGATHRIAP